MINLPPGTRRKLYGAEYSSDRLRVFGFVERAREFTVDELWRRPRQERRIEGLLCGSGKVKSGPQRLSGILLRELIDEAGVRLEEHELPNRTWLRVSGRDGYATMFSWHEIWNSPLGDGVIVALEKDGRPLGESEGRLCLVSTLDLRTGPRRIRYLDSAEVCRF
ncbi:MAG: hypothetical protein A2087_03365 [Spirochaetes bacterium GWD1_61_31]|nr:MAG: hypothetical protein A2Y37_05405 [Spirochaetes bacterium GWB1_60_80]OHD34446.1 MAG: hypothetical protein A2004_10545 [Spirochaetes bacterium GWC1_61_12]OHD38622.1 MAG: hypothetical protein A2087_03365 [Spirochaetes bacterium GWD1_61_31]OHD43160.1 MAG: hypothetical protein A2Y35_01210 [Spirochaetes bacterium GWE1_60_18]OHD58735.1 MAG: hypothetical protein A2Y32_01695 [Spirochaetes bacterium GWF1_60_12]HAP43478.1 sulfite oxidase-like oxidoreductase [Spirochaetaceae bacterium]